MLKAKSFMSSVSDTKPCIGIDGFGVRTQNFRHALAQPTCHWAYTTICICNMPFGAHFQIF